MKPAAGQLLEAAPSHTEAAESALSLRGVVRRMGRETVLNGIDLEVAPGRLVVLRGSNGSGKTTLLRLLATRLRPHAGTATVFGHDIVQRAETVRARIGLLSSSGGSYPVLTATENLSLATSLSGRGSPDEAAAALERVGLAAEADKQVRYYSSGMKKRLGLARQLLLDPDLWLLDEPYAALDEDGKRLVDACLTEATTKGRTVMLASHEQDRDQLAPDAVIELADGRLRLVGPAAGAARP